MNKIKLLIVDDEEDILAMIERYLSTSEKFEVDSFTDPLLVLPHLKENEYDLILLDIMMPQADGIDILEQIKKANSSQKVVMMTAYTTMDKILRVKKNKADGYIIKPFKSMKEFEDKIIEICGV